MQEKNESEKILLNAVQWMQVDNPIGYRNLTLVPIKGQRTEADYILASEAIQAGTLIVKEVSESGSVNTLEVENKGDKRILLLDGEELVGAKQNRILNTTILIEAKTTQKIPVSCVEQGRWRHVSSKFSTGMYSPPAMRQKKNRTVSQSFAECGQAVSNQSEIWQDVDSLCCELQANAPTRAMKDVFDQRAEDFKSYVEALPYPVGAHGVAAAIGERFVAIDVLDRADVFEKIWNRLIAGYAMDAVRQRRREPRSFGQKDAQLSLDGLAQCQISRFAAVGLGTELRLRSDHLLGQALVIDQVLLHMSVFPNDRQSQPEDYPHGIMPPSFRRRPRPEI